MRLALTTPLLALTLMAGPALADSKYYWGANAASSDFETTNVEFDATSIGFKFGREFGKYISVEAHLGFGSQDSSDISDPDIAYGGAFARFNLPFEKVTLYAMAGATKIDIDTNTVMGDDNEAGGGVGIEIYGSENTALTIELMRYGDDNTIDNFSLGFIHRFDFPKLR